MDVHNTLVKALTTIISETNGITLSETLDLLLSSRLKKESPNAYDHVVEFKNLLNQFQIDQVSINALLRHPVSAALFVFFKNLGLG